ncbi:glutamine amidotransferase-related protein [Phenylobacterium montanum]|uniref:Type 1 glutamine amidotransferase n=1 Tax=Phenylobacterium montanum TaxID=2823693 RepID=A0A975FXG3_9CAUL|nr:type 1 glutamine amidotransferase [Caulobacter sp. S6]QUD86722.1 type 1 glutamine amidotransferase [Caulobacter sp. S6]
MKLGILETGAPPEKLREQFGDYPSMFASLLGETVQVTAYDVTRGALPKSAGEQQAWLVTGSAAGVYDPLPWIGPMMEFLREAKGQAPMVGICFGHQAMAQAFGGQVVKSPKGWAIGLNRYDVAEPEPWMDQAPTIAIPASHQDQVVRLPPGARVSLASGFTPYAGLSYDDGRSISFQGHPEFDPAYAAALIQARRGKTYDDETADAGLESLSRPNDRQRVGDWILKFLLQAG